ncbi:MAG: saccharopine dehydrogenase C-terminal domain-containing protein [Planctomycetota bacterium]|jgi:lysine 6-dehydrogenase
MGRTYAVLGAGRQGTAAAYDLAIFGEAKAVRLFDQNQELAEEMAQRVNRLLEAKGCAPVIEGGGLDATDAAAAAVAVRGADAVLSAVPYFLNLQLAKVCVSEGASFCDLGGNTQIVEQTLALGAEAKAAGVTITPDCGLAPGMANQLAAALIESMADPRAVTVRCGGLPVHPKPPLDYMLVFAIEGLTNEYMGEAIVLREGKVLRVPTLTEVESLTVEGLGELEAFTTSGGTSTCPDTYQGRLERFDYKTVRYPGHVAKIRALKELGLLDLDPVRARTVDGERVQIAPREITHRALTRKLTHEGEPDLVFLRVSCEGRDEAGAAASRTIEIIDRKDEVTGFTAMERTTAYPAAIVCAHLASGAAEKGGVRLERVMEGEHFLSELRKRDIPLREW